jgi:hypothetical protein
MKRTLFLCCSLCLVLISGTAQSANEKKIRDILDRQTAAWNRGDLEGFMQGYWKSDSLKFIGSRGVTYGWQNTLDNYRKGYPDTAAMGRLRFEILHINKLSGKYYQVIGKWMLVRTVGNLSGHFTLLFRKKSGEWVIVSDHSS